MLNHPSHPFTGLLENGNIVILSSGILDRQLLECKIIFLKGYILLSILITYSHISHQRPGDPLLCFSTLLTDDEHSLLLSTTLSSPTTGHFNDAGHQYLHTFFLDLCCSGEGLCIWGYAWRTGGGPRLPILSCWGTSTGVSDHETADLQCGLGDMTPTNPDYMACCVGLPKGASVPATCTAIAESKSIITCTHTSLATTDSTNMQAPTDYKPAYATAAATSAAAVTSDTAGQSYESAASAVTTWVTETASPDCAVPSSTEAAASSTPPAEPTYPSSSIVTAEPTYPPSSSSPAPSETYSSAAPAYTCACPEAVSSAPAPAETSDTHGESYTSEDGSPSPPYGKSI